MPNRLKSRAFHDASNAAPRVTKTANPVGRPPQNGHAAQRIRLAPATLQAWQASVNAALAAPRAASTPEALAALAADMGRILDPYVDDAGNLSETGTLPTEPSRWRVVQADGADAEYATLASAAKAYGAKPASLRTMLSRGGGVCRKPAWHDGNESEVRCEKLA